MELPQLTELLRHKNHCDGCTSCCTAIGVEEIGKPYACKCQHEMADGCAIYKSRPGSCKGFECAYTLGWTKLKPSETGLMMLVSIENEELCLDAFFVAAKAKLSRVDAWTEVQRVVNEVGIFQKLRLYPYGANVGTEYPILPPYTPAKYNGNEFKFFNGDQSVLYWSRPIVKGANNVPFV